MKLERKTVQTYGSLALAIDRAGAARDRGVQWMLAHIDDNGKPAESDKETCWSRFPWALAQSGKLEAAAAVMAWAERSGQFDENGRYVLKHNIYKLAHYAIGAWLLHQYDVAGKTMNAIRLLIDQYGGAPVSLDTNAGVGYSDLCYTMQVGYAAVATGTDDIAGAAYRWLINMMEQQSGLEKGILYTRCLGDKLITEIPSIMGKMFFVDFNKPRQEVYNPGIAAAFLAAYAKDRNISEPLQLAEKLLQLNIDGTDQQFNDPESVKICKYGWGVASMLRAQPDKIGKWLPEVLRMAHWFANWQDGDGSWAPSSFSTKEPTVTDKMSKTAEHVMEVNNILIALGFAKGLIEH